MSEGHGDVVRPADAALLAMETATVPMHAGGLFLFDPGDDGAFEFSRFIELIRSRLHLVPRYRQRLAVSPVVPATPVWIDDHDFDLGYHVRHAQLPDPGDRERLTEYAARILSRRLDRDRPLWELYLIDGVADGRFAILGKTHQAMIDALGGIDITTAMFDLDPDDSTTIPEPEPWEAALPPSPSSLAVAGMKRLVTSPAALVDAARKAVAAPVTSLRRAINVGRSVAGVARSNLRRRGARADLNHPPGQHRRMVIHRLPLGEVTAVKDAFGTTVNDVVLALVSDTTGRYLRHRGVDTDGLWLRVLAPLSVREEEEKKDGRGPDNRVVSAFLELPMFEMDPVERLEICHDRMAGVLDLHRAVAAGDLTGLSNFAPPTLHAMASRVAARSGMFNFQVTNVPGPQVPVYCLGARLVGAFPFVPLGAFQSYAVGVTSTQGRMNVAFTVDYDSHEEIAVAPDFLDAALTDLTRSAEATSVRASLAGRPPEEMVPEEAGDNGSETG